MRFLPKVMTHQYDKVCVETGVPRVRQPHTNSHSMLCCYRGCKAETDRPKKSHQQQSGRLRTTTTPELDGHCGLVHVRRAKRRVHVKLWSIDRYEKILGNNGNDDKIMYDSNKFGILAN